LNITMPLPDTTLLPLITTTRQPTGTIRASTKRRSSTQLPRMSIASRLTNTLSKLTSTPS